MDDPKDEEDVGMMPKMDMGRTLRFPLRFSSFAKRLLFD